MAVNYGYANDYVRGSLAYNYDNTAAYPGDWTAPAPQRRVVIPAPPKTAEEVKTHAQPVKYTQSISPLAIVGFICAAVMIVLLLMVKVQLTEITDQAVALERQLTELEVAQNRLLIDYESAFNLTEIEEHATTQLGMQRPRDEQIYYLDSTVPDKAVILENASEEKSLSNRLFDMLASISEYFK